MLKKIILAVPGKDKWAKPNQTYKHVITKFQFKQPNLSSFFNSVLAESQFDIYGFLQPTTKFASKNSLEKVIESFDMNNVGAVYCDSTRQFLPPFNPKYGTLNTSLFINGAVRQHIKFTEDNLFENMYTQLMQKHLLIVHLGEPIFE